VRNSVLEEHSNCSRLHLDITVCENRSPISPYTRNEFTCSDTSGRGAAIRALFFFLQNVIRDARSKIVAQLL
jgi:hypothetical protein